MKYKQENFSSFDGTEKFQINMAMPDRYSSLFDYLNAGSPVIPRGEGLSFCAASGFTDGIAVSTKHFNRSISFDTENGLITSEPGISVGSLHSMSIERGWSLPVIPGHPKITLGGCVAFNVHGKSQFHKGNFIDHVESFKVYHPSHGELKCDRSNNSELFYLTFGGFGLTGFITEVTLRLARLEGKSLEITKVPVRNLIDAVEIMEKYSDTVDSLYSWNNLNLSGRHFGRGIVYLEKLSTEACKDKYKERCLSAKRSGFLGFNLYNRASVKVMTSSYGMIEKLATKDKIVDLRTAAFPINGREIYYQLFGKKGLREYQFIVAREKFEATIYEVGKAMCKHKISATLGSLKLFKGNTKYLNFCGTGVCLAIDIPATANSIGFFEGLDSIMISVNGIVNLSKDGRVPKRVAEMIFPEYNEFASALKEYDPKKIFNSALRKSLGV